MNEHTALVLMVFIIFGLPLLVGGTVAIVEAFVKGWKRQK